MKKTIKTFLILATSLLALAAYAPIGCGSAMGENDADLKDVLVVRTSPDEVTFSSTVPTDVAGGYNATANDLAVFAWQEFIALNWPAKKNPSPATGMSDYYRGQASTDNLGSTGSGGTVVWETYQHRSELFPYYSTSSGNKLPSINAIPSYIYNPYSSPITVPPGVSATLFNNLDEANEIGLCDMYYTPFAEQVDALRQQYGMTPTAAQANEIEAAALKAGLLYEVKGNPVYFNYIDANSYNNATPRNTAQAQTRAKIQNQAFTNPVFEFPSGTLELKATWRHYDSTLDTLNHFHWANAIHYLEPDSDNQDPVTVANDTFLLIGLHVVHKTPSIPTFTFATFEHVTNETNGFRYVNSHPETNNTYESCPDGGRLLPDDGIRTAVRQYAIPGYLNDLNTSIQQQLRTDFGSDIVWANYRLIGVQAKVSNNPQSRGGDVPDQEFFLSNFATETNNALQFFQGGLVGPASPANVPAPTVQDVFLADASGHYTGYTAGGCLGCHGAVGQLPGGDFSVISVTVNKFAAEPTEPYPMEAVSAQNPDLFPLSQSTATPPCN